MKIFAIDDEVAAVYFLKKALAEVCPNDELYTYDDVSLFLTDFKKELPDLVFLDVEMPEMDGMSLAKELISIKDNVNIIFVTAFTEYAFDAFKLNASSYIVKPANKEKLVNALSHLRYTIATAKDLVIKTFGSFEIFYKGIPVKFRSPKSKEVLAYLVDRQGALINKKEIAAAIYEDDYSRTIQSILSRNIQYLNEDLNNAGIENFFIIDNGYRVDLSLCDCDLIDYLNGNHDLFNDEYMEQYSWAEYKKYKFYK